MLQSYMQQAFHEGAGTDDHAACINGIVQGSDGARGLLFSIDKQLDDVSLEQPYAGSGFQHSFHARTVGGLVTLGARCADAGALGSVQHPELNGGGIRIQAHGAAQSIYFPDNMPLGKAADGRIAGHLADGVQVMGKNGYGTAHAGSG